MSLSKHFRTLKELEKKGIPVEYGENSKGKMMVFHLSRAGGANLEYLAYLDVVTKPMRRQIDNGTVDNKILEGVLKKAFLEKCLKGWDNVEAEWEPTTPQEVTLADGTVETRDVYPDLPFNRANAEKLYEYLPDLFTDHQQLVNKNTMFLDDVRKAEAKNS